MRLRVSIFAILITACCSSYQDSYNSEDIEVLSASSLHPFGRYAWTSQKDLELVGSAVNFGFSFSGDHCEVFAYLNDTAALGYLQYEVDGVYQKRIKVIGDGQTPVSIAAKGPGVHTAWIYKTTEAQTGPIFISKIKGNALKPLKKPNLPIIEFIGNSITCGAASDASAMPCGSGNYHDHANAYNAYGPRVARELGVNYIMSCVSGIGIYRNWNTDGPTMSQVYEKTDFQVEGNRKWDFSTYRPTIVSIALGTNDYSDGDGKHFRAPFDSATFVTRYILFVKLVKSKYPAAQIALLSSPMLNGDRRQALQNCLFAVKAAVDGAFPKDKAVAVFFFRPMQSRGCLGHPSVEDHAILADELLPFFKALL